MKIRKSLVSQDSSDVSADQRSSRLLPSARQAGRRLCGDRKDHFLREREGWLRHLLLHTPGISLTANICIHLCQDGQKVITPGKKTQTVIR